MKLEDAKRLYIEFRTTSGRKPATVVKDEQCLTTLFDYYGDIEVSLLTDLDSFFNAVNFSSASYFNSHISVFRSFFEWCRKRGHMPVDSDPVYGREHRPNPPKNKKYIPVEEFPLLIDAAEEPRDRVIIALGLYLFLRQGEISTLRLSDLNLDEGRIGVRVWKTNQFDRMQINAELDTELRRWLRVYKEAPMTGFLIPSKRPMWGRLVYDPTQNFTRPYRAVQGALGRMGWTDAEIDGEGGHLLRRSGARAMYFAMRKGGNERAMALVQRRLHHSTRAMTERYIGITAEDADLDDALIGKMMFEPATEAKVYLFPARGAV